MRGSAPRLNRIMIDWMRSSPHSNNRSGRMRLRPKRRSLVPNFGLQRHIVWEEDVLFPKWEENSGMAEGGPTQVMRTEHRIIGDCLEAIHQKVQANNPDSDLEEQRLVDVLKSHNMKEERILYPSIDQVISDQERAELYQAMKDIPEERYRTCCGSGLA